VAYARVSSHYYTFFIVEIVVFLIFIIIYRPLHCHNHRIGSIPRIPGAGPRLVGESVLTVDLLDASFSNGQLV
jgi:hypothetical protein